VGTELLPEGSNDVKVIASRFFCATCRQAITADSNRVEVRDNHTGVKYFFDSWECLADWALVKRIAEKVMGERR
jgi:hypothetical protein